MQTKPVLRGHISMGFISGCISSQVTSYFLTSDSCGTYIHFISHVILFVYKWKESAVPKTEII